MSTYEGDGCKFPDEKDAIEAAEDSQGITVEMSDADDADIEVVDDTPEADRGRKPLEENVTDPDDDELKGYSDKVQSRIKQLTHARHDERRKAEALAREHEELARYAQAITAERDRLRQHNTQGANIVSQQALTLTDAALAAAKKELKEAHEAFDTDAIVEAQEKLQHAINRKNEITRIQAQRPVAQPPQNSVQSRATAPVAPRLDDRTSTWIAKNKWFGEGGDEALTGYALGLHQKLVRDNGESFTNTDEYYSQIDKAMRRAFPDKFGVQRGKPGTNVAPVSRTAANGKRVVQLSQSQINLSKRLGITPQQYAAGLLNLENQNG